MNRIFLTACRVGGVFFLFTFLLIGESVSAQGGKVSQADRIETQSLSAPAMCKSDETYTVQEDSIEVQQQGFSCALSVSKVKQYLQESQTRIIDIRSRDAFDRFHIDGAMNLSVAELAKKNYLISSSIILVGDGRQDARLYESCAYLKGNGFESVFVLRGGMMSWIFEKEANTGHFVQSPVMRQLSADDLAKQATSTRSLYVFQREVSHIGQYFAASSRLVILRNDMLVSAVERRVKDSSDDYMSIVLIGDQQSGLDKKAAVLQQKTGIPVFLYIDGGKLYEQVVARNKAQAEPKPPKFAQCTM